MKIYKGVLACKAEIKSVKVFGIIGFVTTQLLLTGCGLIEKQPITDPIINIDEYLRESNLW